MNCGLTNLDTLKKALLPQTMAGETRFDTMISIIGLGVRGAFEQFTNRSFGYVAGDTMEFTGDRPHYYLPRYPVTGISLVRMRFFQTDNWTTITDQPISVSYPNGLVHFGYTLGRSPLRVQVTYSGGFWFETLEPDDAAYPSTPPTVTDQLAINAGATVAMLPDELQAAFIWQCEQIWAARDKLGVGLADKPNEQSGVAELGLSPLVKQILQQFTRYQLS